jgi:hypothetical protein
MWQAMGAAGERSHVEPPVFVRTTIHPHAASRYHSLDIVAIDLTRVTLWHVPGTDDHDVKRLPKTVQPGLVPTEHQGRLLAVFNGGFQAQHGYWGMMTAGLVLLPPKDIACTIATNAGTVRIAPWSSLAADAAGLSFFRQTPPCLVDGGEIHRQLLAKNDRMWGGKNWHERTRRRSAVGLDATGKILFYAVGTELEPLGLAQAMQIAGAPQAAELDINWNWTRFLLFGTLDADPELRITSTLLEGMPHNSRSYVARAEARDFFYLTLKDTAR